MKKVLSFLFSIYWLFTFSIQTIILASGIFIASLFKKSIKDFIVIRIVRLWARISILLSFSRVKIYNENKEKLTGNYVIVSNHLASADIIFTAAFAPIYFLFFSKEGVFRLPVIGYAMRQANFIPVDTSSPRKSAQSLLTSIKRVEDGHSIVIYPEGTRNTQVDRIAPFKKGATVIADRTKTPILPMVLVGTNKLLPGKGKYALFSTWPSKVSVHILKPILVDDDLHPANKNSPLTEDQKLEAVHKRMLDVYLKFNV